MNAFTIRLVKPGSTIDGNFLEQRGPKEVKRNGYGFTNIEDRAWLFETRAQAQRKCDIVERHFSYDLDLEVEVRAVTV